ncbi:GM12043 [Drosophila sechellia]|uniref:GM12043 n=1 Tax=Drosophila sechellia TaxID=7238 RepID=B4IJ54_DROSE|nr:GM12043 [Drosophila sechellia]
MPPRGFRSASYHSSSADQSDAALHIASHLKCTFPSPSPSPSPSPIIISTISILIFPDFDTVVVVFIDGRLSENHVMGT